MPLMFGSLLGGIQKYLLIGASVLVGVLVVALKVVSAQKTAARAEATRQKVKAKGEEAARKSVTSTVEKTRDVEDDIRRSDAGQRRDVLRDYASGTRPDDPD